MTVNKSLSDNLIERSALLDVNATAKLLSMSPRNVYRLVNDGKMPAPLKVGGKNLWRRDVLLEWIAADCQSTCPEVVKKWTDRHTPLVFNQIDCQQGIGGIPAKLRTKTKTRSC